MNHHEAPVGGSIASAARLPSSRRPPGRGGCIV